MAVRFTAGVVYDLVRHCRVDAHYQAEQLSFEVALAPCGGGISMIAPHAIEQVVIDAPAQVDPPGRVRCRIDIVDALGDPLNAVVPLAVNVWDAEGRAAEFSGHYAAVAGSLEIHLDIAPNDPAGVWQVEAHELASGRTGLHALRVGKEPETETRGGDLPADVADPVQPKG